MKRISAVICELNPLHDGHRYVFSRAKEGSDLLIAVMSGNFVQRGETAVYDKYRRALDAIGAGADIVLELPFPYSASSAEYFAHAGVRIAEGAGANCLYFGSECGDIDALKLVGNALESEQYKKGMKVGRSAALRAELLLSLCGELPESLLSSPNDILGAEYCRRAKIKTVAVKRISAISASQIRARELSSEGSDMLDPSIITRFEYEYFRTRRHPLNVDIAECTGGVYERLYKTAFDTGCFTEWAEKIKTKQYTNSRLRRASLFALCNVSTDEMKSDVSFTRLLCANARGRSYLSSVKKTLELPIITNASDKKYLNESVVKQIQLSEFADNIYCLCRGDTDPCFFAKCHPQMVE